MLSSPYCATFRDNRRAQWMSGRNLVVQAVNSVTDLFATGPGAALKKLELALLVLRFFALPRSLWL